MASTYSTRLKAELIGSGEQANSWGNTTNDTFSKTFEEAISNVYEKNLGAVSSPYDLTNSNCLLYTSPSPRDLSTSRMPSSA